MTAPLLFIDTETTGLGDHDEIWEVSFIRRARDGIREYAKTFQIEHDRDLCAALPTAFRTDHRARFNHDAALTTEAARAELKAVMGREVHLVAANPAFDARMLAKLLLGETPWHYHLIDVEAMALGYLRGRRFDEKGEPYPIEALRPPWKSDELSRLCGVEPPTRDRHTAEGDVEWVRHWHDAMDVG